MIGKGTAYLNIDGIEITVRDMFYAPDLTENLLSVSAINETGSTVKFSPTECKIFNAKGDFLAKATKMQGTFKLNATIKCLLASSGDNIDIVQWHRPVASSIGPHGVQWSYQNES